MTKLLIFLLLLAAVPLAAQEEKEPWKDSFYPILRYSGNDGVSIGVRYAWTQRSRYEDPFFNSGAIIGDLAWSASGSLGASIRFKGPGRSEKVVVFHCAIAASQSRPTR